MFEMTLVAGWADMDANAHMRNTAYLDNAVDVRLTFLAEHGFPMSTLLAHRIGPVVMRDEVEYFREVGLLDVLRGTLALAGSSEDGSRFTMRNEFYRADGKLAARINTTGGWLDLATRRLTAPPQALLQAMQAIPRTEDFQVLASSLR